MFAKAPIPGRVKTRLLSTLDPASATNLHRLLVSETISMACASQLASVDLWYSSEHAFFSQCARRFTLQLHTQKGEDLGLKMRYAMEQTLSYAQTAVIIGTDCPVMDANYLKAAFHELDDGKDVVIGPAEDGGYVLFGARRIDSSLFSNIRWGSGSVLSNTRSALQALGWSWSELDTLWDIDRPEDLDRVRSDQRLSKLFAPLSP